MARKKLIRVPELDKGRTRLSAVISIDPALDLGNGITAFLYKTEIDELTTRLSKYNTNLSTIDDQYNACIAQMKVVSDLSERVLSGVASKFGKDSSEYEMAGGVKKSERKKPKAKTQGLQ